MNTPNVIFSNKVTAASFAGDGASLTALNASNISSGTIAAARLPKATTSALGAVMLGYSASGKNYAIQADSNGKLYVNVPWTDDNTKVTQTVTSSNATYPLLLAPSGQTVNTTTTSYFDSGVTLNPSTNTITANISGHATRLSSVVNLVGNSTTASVYWNPFTWEASGAWEGCTGIYTLSDTESSFNGIFSVKFRTRKDGVTSGSAVVTWLSASTTTPPTLTLTTTVNSTSTTYKLYITAPSTHRTYKISKIVEEGLVPTIATGSTTTITGTVKSTASATTATNVTWSGITSKPSYYDAKAIKSISRSGTTFTATHLDGTTSTFTQQDNNTNNAVTQSRSTSSSWRALLTHYTAAAEGINPEEATNKVYYNEAISIQPSTGTLRATVFKGSGASLTSLNASNITSGTIAADRLPSATTSSIGAVKIGSNITVSSGVISLSKANVTTALGYTPDTPAQVDAKIAALVDSAPSTLNTLNELAAALGNDPNFATTIAASIGSKISSVTASGTTPLTLSASTNSTTKAVTISGSVANASTSAAGVVTTGAQSFAGLKTFTGGLFINSATGTNPLTIARNSGTGESTKFYQDDQSLYISMTNDETSCSTKFVYNATDSENGDGTNAHTATVTMGMYASGATYVTAGTFNGALAASNITGTLGVAHGGTGANSFTTNYVLMGNNTSAIKTENAHFNYTAGTTAIDGYEEFVIGNSTASGTAGNRFGRLALYSKKNGGVYLVAADATSWVATNILPNTSGTILNTGTTSWTGRDATTAKIGTLKINGTNNILYDMLLQARGQNISAAEITDINTIKTPSVYYSNNSTETSGLANSPQSASSGYRLMTFAGYQGTSSYGWQLAAASSKIYWRLLGASNNSPTDWYGWIKFKYGTQVGSVTAPVYLSSDGVPTACSTYAGGTAVTLNGTSKGASTVSFYAPTGAGTSGYILKSNGSGAPSWLQTLPVANGGTGNTAMTANRLVWSESASKLTAGYHYASGTKVAINSTSAPTETFYVNGTAKINGALTVTSLNLTSFAKTLTLSANTWTDTGISGSNLTTGTYIIQIERGGEYFSGVMSWTTGKDTAPNATECYDEIVLHNAGSIAGSTSHIMARTVRTTSGIKLQICGNMAMSSLTVNIKCAKII